MYSDAVALTIFANSHLAGHECPDFWPKAQVFQWTESITFEALAGRFMAAEDPLTWVEKLKSFGVIGFHVHAGLSSPIAEAFAGAGSAWVIEAIHEDKIEHWKRVHRSPRESRFVRNATAGPVCPVATQGLEVLRTDLTNAAKRALALIEQNLIEADDGSLRWFGETFNGALTALTSADPTSGFAYSEMNSPTSLPLEAKQILSACASSWVFGGAGSWNDAYPKPGAEVEYRDVTGLLYRTVIAAICEAANTSYPGQPS